MNSSRSSRSHVRSRRRSVSATISAIERGHTSKDGLDCLVDMLQVRSEAQDRATQAEAAVHPSPAQHHPALLLDMADQALVELVGIAAFGQVAKSDHRQLWFGS